MKIIVTLFCIAVLCVSNVVFAHGTGLSYEENKDGYKIDIGYSESITALESTRFDFALFPENSSSSEADVFTDVWVTVTQDKQIFFAGGVHKPVFGTTGFTYVFPKEGTYTVSTRFQKDGEMVVKTEFPLTVIPALDSQVETGSWQMPAAALVAGLFFGGSIGYIITRKIIKK